MVGMTDRKERILEAIIQRYVASYRPVGSRTIARSYDLGISPATIRNEMADLEEMGYLEQPHTSAGRIPSDRGYRLYVDQIMQRPEPDPRLLRRIKRQLTDEAEILDAVMEKTIKILSMMTDCLALMIGPRIEDARLKTIQVIPLQEQQALFIAVTEDGLVESQTIEVPPGLSQAELERISQTLTHYLSGSRINGIAYTTLTEIRHELSQYRVVVELVLDLLDQMENGDSRQSVYFQGTSKMLKQPEFHDLDKVHYLLGTLERQDVIRSLLQANDRGRPGVTVAIGRELHEKDLRDFSLVTTTLRRGDRVIGRLGVLGPKRMHYRRVVGTVTVVTEGLSSTLTRR